MLINTVGSSDDPITLDAFSSSSGIFVIYIMEYGSEIVGEISQAARGAWVSDDSRGEAAAAAAAAPAPAVVVGRSDRCGGGV